MAWSSEACFSSACACSWTTRRSRTGSRCCAVLPGSKALHGRSRRLLLRSAACHKSSAALVHLSRPTSLVSSPPPSASCSESAAWATARKAPCSQSQSGSASMQCTAASDRQPLPVLPRRPPISAAPDSCRWRGRLRWEACFASLQRSHAACAARHREGRSLWCVQELCVQPLWNSAASRTATYTAQVAVRPKQRTAERATFRTLSSMGCAAC